MVTPGSTAPVESVTVPPIACAPAAVATVSTHMKAAMPIPHNLPMIAP